MNETALYSEALNGSASGSAGVFREVFYNVVDGVVSIVYNIHQRKWSDISGFKHWFSVRINDCIVRADFSSDKFLHDVKNIRSFFVKEFIHIFFVFDFICIRSTNTVVWFCNDRISDFFYECEAVFDVVNQVIAGNWNTGFCVVFFHFRFVFDFWHITGVESTSDIEICAELGIAFQPVFIIRF